MFRVNNIHPNEDRQEMRMTPQERRPLSSVDIKIGLGND